ncbi:uncharacterized protein CMC5_060430 [Chondromyces crocatus]|uniref:Uncharacterized protein n=1 Tax=Chondromyces crocatus TaxID=52 RepID=A0A0K1EMG5_CHOCO|nr:uncharacterized protein CMC5_060430 [Chondromyces crocatus]
MQTGCVPMARALRVQTRRNDVDRRAERRRSRRWPTELGELDAEVTRVQRRSSPRGPEVVGRRCCGGEGGRLASSAREARGDAQGRTISTVPWQVPTSMFATGTVTKPVANTYDVPWTRLTRLVMDTVPMPVTSSLALELVVM